MKSYIFTELIKYYDVNNIVNTSEYIYAVGNIPVALVAHLDTVWEAAPPKYTFYDPYKNVMLANGGLGADDRAGCIAIIDILRKGLRPHVIFTTNEEIGGLGAQALAKKPCPFKNLKYIIELDRQGKDDCVFYDCMNEKFIKYVESFGFNYALGTFSDISFLCNAWHICGVNLSIGYINEHTEKEMLFLVPMYNTINQVIKMLQEDNIPNFKWETNRSTLNIFYNKLNIFHCASCGQPLSAHETIKVKRQGKVDRMVDYCFNCLPNKVSCCPVCGELFENTEGINSDRLCDNCSINGTFDF